MVSAMSCWADHPHGTLLVTAAENGVVMTEPVFQISADVWPYHPEDEGRQIPPIGGEPWSAERFEELWTQVEHRNGPMLRAVADVEAAAA